MTGSPVNIDEIALRRLYREMICPQVLHSPISNASNVASGMSVRLHPLVNSRSEPQTHRIQGPTLSYSVMTRSSRNDRFKPPTQLFCII